MKTTNFFTEIGKFTEHADLKMTITKKGDTMTVSLFPELKGGGDKLMPFTATGTEHELDEGFIPEISKAVDAAGGFKTNTEQFANAVKEHKEEEVKEAAKNKAAKKPTPVRKKSAAKKVAPAAKKSAPAAKKVASKVKSKPPVKAKAQPAKEADHAAEVPEAAAPAPVQQSIF